MLTKEQKIEKLLKDLDAYAQTSDPVDKYGLPCFCKYDMDKMKAIVQAFVDSLEEDNNLAWDANQAAAYQAFLEVGIPGDWAKVMVDRIEDDGWVWAGRRLPYIVGNFALWRHTPEGFHFWCELHNAVYEEGAAAFSKFQCPQ